MTRKAKKILCGTLAAVASVLTLELVYLLGYHNGSRDALDWDFSAVVEGKGVKLRHASTLLRSKIEFRAVPNVNIVSAPLTLPGTQPRAGPTNRSTE